MKKSDLEEMLTVEELSKIIKLAPGTIYNRINTHRNFPIPFVKMGCKVRFNPGDVKQFLQNNLINQTWKR